VAEEPRGGPDLVKEELVRRDRGDVSHVGGKNASPGEMVSGLATEGIRVPSGFATTRDDWRFIDENGLRERIASTLGDLVAGKMSLAEAGQSIRWSFLRSEWSRETADAIASLRLKEVK
jgi:pyruvate,water dikinase